MSSLEINIDLDKGGGLVPAIVQHAVTGRVLMLAYMNAEALEKTLSSRQVTFYSRSRQCLWTKGETSGNTLELRDMEVDCDADTILLQAMPSGPVCHLEKSSCFDGRESVRGCGIIGRLEATIDDRIREMPDNSYTAKLVHGGARKIAQKIGEEGVELALAAAGRDRGETVAEAADLIYHLLVMLKIQGLEFSEVARELEARHRS